VCGRLVFEGGASAGRELDYWARENEWKSAESRADSCLGANGAIYAIRRELFWTGFPSDTVIDDFVIGMKVREQGRRMVYWGRAVAWEETPPGWAQEFRRRIRIGSGAFQAMGLCRRCLSPRYGRFAVMFAFHKVARWLTPLLILTLAGVAMVQAILWGRGWVNGLILYGTAGGLILAAVGGWARLRGIRRLTAIQAWAYFCLVQAAFLCGFFRFIKGGLSGSWERTERG
jgi:cellulose synthase/poly-beta-1,6-N-acetylglucosamine synthase-like glycosyltransferase